MLTPAERLAGWTHTAEQAIECRDLAIIDMHTEGASLRAIAEIAHLSHTQIANIIKKGNPVSKDCRYFTGVLTAPNRWDVKHRDGRRAAQVFGLVKAATKEAAARAAGVSIREFNDYWAETGNDQDKQFLDAHNPGTLLVCPLDHGTVLGSTDPIPVVASSR